MSIDRPTMHPEGTRKDATPEQRASRNASPYPFLFPIAPDMEWVLDLPDWTAFSEWAQGYRG
jgi:hypothetical protein